MTTHFQAPRKKLISFNVLPNNVKNEVCFCRVCGTYLYVYVLLAKINIYVVLLAKNTRCVFVRSRNIALCDCSEEQYLYLFAHKNQQPQLNISICCSRKTICICCACEQHNISLCCSRKTRVIVVSSKTQPFHYYFRDEKQTAI